MSLFLPNATPNPFYSLSFSPISSFVLVLPLILLPLVDPDKVAARGLEITAL